MAILDVLKYDGPNDELVWKWSSFSDEHRGEELRFGSQLVVNESQEAIFYRGGKILDVFGPGTHTLTAYNLPLVTQLLSLAFGGDSPFKAEVFFVNKAVSQDAKWGLIPFKVMERQFQVPIPIAARGSYSVRIVDSRKFLVDLVGVTKSFSQKSLQKVFRGLINEQVKTAFGRVMKELELSPFELETEVQALNDIVRPPVAQSMLDFGIEAILFKIEAVSVVTEDERVQQVLNAYQKLMEEDMEERLRLKRRRENLKTFSVERSYDVSQAAAESIGSSGGGGMDGESGGGLLGTVLGLGVAMPVVNNLSGLVSDSMKSGKVACPHCAALSEEGAKFCSSCGKAVAQSQGHTDSGSTIACNACGESYPAGYKFCPQCGDPYTPCPHCGKDQAQGLARCFDCDMPLSLQCTHCDEPLQPGHRFCGACGQPQQNQPAS